MLKFKYFCLLALTTILFFASKLTFSIQENRQIGKKRALLWTTDWSTDDKLVATGGDDSLLRIYSGKDFKQVTSFKINDMIRQVNWHPSKHILAIATAGNNVITLDIKTKNIVKLEGITSGARGIGWNYNGELLATADNDGLVKIWNAKGKLLRTIKKEDENSYFSVHWHPKKNIIAASGDDIRIIDTTGRTLKIIKHRKENTGILAIRWHPSGEFLAIGDYGHDSQGIKSIIQFWKANGTLIKTLDGSKGEYRNIEWNKEGTLLSSASDALRIWDRNGKLLFTGKSKDLLWGLAWNNKSEQIITTSINGYTHLWTAKATLLQKLTP